MDERSLEKCEDRSLRRNRLRRMDLLAQQELLNLAGRSLGNRTEHHGLRGLEAGHLAATEGDDVGFRGARVVLQFDEGAGHFAPFRIGLCHDGCEQYRGVLVEYVLDLDRADVLAA